MNDTMRLDYIEVTLFGPPETNNVHMQVADFKIYLNLIATKCESAQFKSHTKFQNVQDIT